MTRQTAPATNADLTDDYVKQVCRIGQGLECCRYLTLTTGTGWTCEKHSPMKFELDARVEAETMNARGDNCPGVPAPTQPAYRLKRADRANHDVPLEDGTIVYRSRGYDYGLASDDTRFTGIPHVSVSLTPDGDYPCFTIPLEDLEPQP